MHAIICILEFMNFMLFIIKFIKFKQRIKFKKFELHNYGKLQREQSHWDTTCSQLSDPVSLQCV